MKDILNKINEELLKDEGISVNDLELVDLEIAFSPVIPVKGGRPTEVIETIGEKYILLDFPLISYAISKEELTVMRYRFLMNR